MSLVIIQIKFIWGNSIGMNLQNRGLKLSRSRNYQPVSVFIQRQGEGSKRKNGFNEGSGWVRARVRDSGLGSSCDKWLGLDGGLDPSQE